MLHQRIVSSSRNYCKTVENSSKQWWTQLLSAQQHFSLTHSWLFSRKHWNYLKHYSIRPSKHYIQIWVRQFSHCFILKRSVKSRQHVDSEFIVFMLITQTTFPLYVCVCWWFAYIEAKRTSAAVQRGAVGSSNYITKRPVFFT